MIKYLAESDDYKVTSEDEMVTLTFKDQPEFPVIIGDFYGNPVCAIISSDEKYIAMGGCGMIIYKLQESFDAYQYNQQSRQYTEFFRNPENIWWIRCMYQDEFDVEDHYFRFIASNSEGTSLYRMNCLNNEIEKISLITNE